jgi:hypothetical protein
MKNLQIILTSLIVFLSLGTIFSQNLSIGVRAGADYFTIKNDLIEDDAKFTLGYNFAIPVEYNLNSVFSLQPELNFTQKGVAFKFDQDGEEINLKLRTNYLELPVLFKARYGTQAIKAYAFAGPSLGFAASRKATTQIGDGDMESESIDFVDDGEVQDQRWEFAIVGGIGLDIKAGPGSFIIDARYSHGLTDDSKFEGKQPEDWKKSFNRGCTLSIGYKIPIGK